MRVLFYSTCSSVFDPSSQTETQFPSCRTQLEQFAKKFNEHTFIIATQPPGMFLTDNDFEMAENSLNNIEYYTIPCNNEEEIAQFLISLNPDICLAASFYVNPFDWLSVKDSIVDSYLQKNKIKTFCHRIDFSMTCFDKFLTSSFLQKNKINTPHSLYINHSLFINAANRPHIKSNVYRTGILEQIKSFKFPVIIKDTTGLSSYGTDVLENYPAIYDWLKSKKFTSDRIIEEYIQGIHAGTEIYAIPKKNGFKYKIQPPLIFSVNKYGITSPKQSIKTGPLKKTGYKINSLNRMLKNLAKKANLKSFTQIDLIFDKKKWYVIEINPRLSGMSQTYAAMENTTIYDYMAECTSLKSKRKTEKNFVLNIKLPLLEENELKKIAQLPYTKLIHQIKNNQAKQLRERGYCELIITGRTKKELKNNLNHLRINFPSQTEEVFLEKAEELLTKL